LLSATPFISKPYRDPATGKFAKKPANPSVLLTPSAASTSSCLPLVFPTLRSHPIPSSFDLPASPDHTSDTSNTKSSRSPSKLTSFTTFLDALQRTRSLLPDPPSPESLIPSVRLVPLDDTKTSVPVSCSIVDLLSRLAAQEPQEPLPMFVYTQPSLLQPLSASPSSATPSSVSSVSASQLSSPVLAPQTSSPTPAFTPLSTLRPPHFQSQPVPPPPALATAALLANSQQPPAVPNPPPAVFTPQLAQLTPQLLAQLLAPPLLAPAAPPALAPAPQPLFNAAPPAPLAPPTMANNATGLATMPGPHSADTPFFSKSSNISFTDFMHEYHTLATANSLTNAEKVKTILRYISLDLRKFWKSVNGYTTGDWAAFSMALEAMYLDTSAATRLTKKALQDLLYNTSRSHMTNEEDVMDYYREFLELTNPLCTAQQLSKEDRDAKFFKGFHHDDREILSGRLFSMKPNHPQDKPYKLGDVFKAAQSYFSNAQFYRPVQQGLRSDDYNYDSDFDYKPQASRRSHKTQLNQENHNHRYRDPHGSLDNYDPRCEDCWQRDRDCEQECGPHRDQLPWDQDPHRNPQRHDTNRDRSPDYPRNYSP